MKYVLTADEMKACDRDTIDRIGIPSMVLMERAALSAVEAIAQKQPDLKGKKVLIAAGTGNNGGDGLAIGRLLSRKGAEVTFYLEGKREKFSAEMGLQVQILENLGFSIQSKLEDNEYSIIVDALFGIGLSRDIAGNYGEAIDKINGWGERGAFICSVDISSGVCADTGKIYGHAVKANLTVTFAFAKRGHFLYPGRAYTGELTVSDIGVTEKSFKSAAPSGFYYEKEELSKLLPTRSPWGNKGTFGKALLLAGSRDMSGACILCGRGILRTGAGMLKIITSSCNREIVQQSLPEALLYTYKERPKEEEVVKALAWVDVIVIGPGMGTDETAYELFKYVLMNSSHPMIIDADGLNLLAAHKELRKLAVKHKGMLILTPHPGELVRLTGKGMENYPLNREGIIRELAEEFQAVVVAKDAATLVVEAGRRDIYFNVSGNDGMAAAGSGDVLAGIIGGLLAQGMNSFEGACLGAYLHGLAGDAARREKGAYGMIAGDICESLPGVFVKAENYTVRQEE